MKFTHLAFAALCAACATAPATDVYVDPNIPAPEPEIALAAPPEPDAIGALQERLLRDDPNFAGLYLDPVGSNRAVVMFTGDDPAAQLARHTTDPHHTARGARYSYARLLAVQSELGSAFQRERIYFMSSSTNVHANRVVFEVVSQGETRALAAARGITIPEEVVLTSQGGAVADPQTLPPEITNFPQARYPAGAEMQALLRGRLFIENGCVRVGEGEHSDLIVWPSSALLERQGDRITIRDQISGNRVAVGDMIEMGGGQMSELDESHLTGGVPTTCPGPFWIAATGWRVAP